MAFPLSSPLILGHRGAPLEAPENTLRSFALAIEQGADGVELDVQRSSDGVPVVLHDSTLQRTTDGHGSVAAHTWKQLSMLRSGGEPLPSLEQAASWATDCQAWLNVEVKAERVEEAVLTVLRRAGALERTVLSSFQFRVVQRLHSLAPEVPCFLLTERWNEGLQETVAQSGAQGVCLRADAAGPLALDVLRREGYPVLVWTVDEASHMRELLLRGVAGLITNRPAQAAAIRAGIQNRD